LIPLNKRKNRRQQPNIQSSTSESVLQACGSRAKPHLLQLSIGKSLPCGESGSLSKQARLLPPETRLLPQELTGLPEQASRPKSGLVLPLKLLQAELAR
jgi:hypothetical protein